MFKSKMCYKLAILGKKRQNCEMLPQNGWKQSSIHCSLSRSPVDFGTLGRLWHSYWQLIVSNRPNKWITITCYFWIRGSSYTEHVKCGVCMFPAWISSAFPDCWTSAVISGNCSTPKTPLLTESFNLFACWNDSSNRRHAQLLHQSPLHRRSVYLC